MRPRLLLPVLALVPVLAFLPSSGATLSETVEVSAVRVTGGEVTLLSRTVPPAALAQTVRELRGTPHVVAVGVPAERSTLAAPPEPSASWGWERLGGARLRDVGDGSGLTVAVLDTGVDAAHPELAGRVLPGKDYLDPAGDARRDPNGHGTHVAGIVAAARDGRGVEGVAPAARILPVRVLGADGIGDDTHLALGIVWAAENGADVMNLSIGGAVPSSLLADSIAYALDRGVLVVVAAGNDGAFANQPSYPAAYPEALAVGSLDASDRRSIFSNTGPYLDIAAPGSMIRSTWPGGGHWISSGTSMAAPFVSGAAVLAQAHTGLRGRELRTYLEANAMDLGTRGRDAETGHGLVNALAPIGSTPAAPGSSPAQPDMPALPPIPSLPELPAPSLPALPALPAPSFPALPAPSLPALPSLPAPSPPARPVLPSPTLPSLPGATPRPPTAPSPAPPSRAPSGRTARFEVAVGLNARRVEGGYRVRIRLTGHAALLPGRTVVLRAGQRSVTLRTGFDGTVTTTVRARRGSQVVVRVPADAFVAETVINQRLR